jgi:hypothetical protein
MRNRPRFDWLQFVGFNNYDLAKVDLVELNHACATGLPGADRVSLEQCTRTVDDFARRVAWMPQHHMGDFHRQPSHFHNSLPYFQTLCLVTAL